MSFYVNNPNPTNSPSGSFSSSSSIASTSFDDVNNKTKTKTVVKLSTDPQSIAARHRRHRISDRFKILQSLVPGGSKLDTVSMLEEAIQYVKFLKHQILIHQSLNLMISSSASAVPDQKRGDGVENDHVALARGCNFGGESEVGFGCNDDFFAQMQLSDLPCPLPEALFHFQGQECNFTCDSPHSECYFDV